MRATVTMIDHRGGSHVLGPGDLIGRVKSAALHVDDARVSEAHAMVSLREGQLKLLALRGAFSVRGRPLREVVLAEGLELRLAKGLGVTVSAVDVPGAMLGIHGQGLVRQVLPTVCSLIIEPEPRLVARYVEDAPLRIWSVGDGWRASMGEQEPIDVGAGQTLTVQGRTFSMVSIPLNDAGQAPTEAHGGAPLRIVANFDSVHIHREGGDSLLITGMLARLISELVALDGPVSWVGLAGLLWPDEAESGVVRSRLDSSLTRLRGKLRAKGMRTDLVRMGGSGQVELVIYPQDVVEDRT